MVCDVNTCAEIKQSMPNGINFTTGIMKGLGWHPERKSFGHWTQSRRVCQFSGFQTFSCYINSFIELNDLPIGLHRLRYCLSLSRNNHW